MTLDENDFFRQATMRICSSLDIETAMWATLKYLESYIPLTGIELTVGMPGLSVIETLARVTPYRIQDTKRIIPLPQEIRAEFEREWKALQDVMIVNRADSQLFFQTMSRLDNMPETSVMIMRLKIQDERLFALTTYVVGTDRYKREHAQLLALLHDPFTVAMSNALKHQEVIQLKEKLADDNRYLHEEMHRISGDEIIGRDRGLKEIFTMVRRVAPLDSPVLLLGETGSGKEVIANAIHYLSHRRDGPFIKVNCGAIPETLIDSELFGHEKGAFTGAVAQKRGRFERAHKGTILLDEIGELPLEAQVRLLHVLQNRKIERVGGTNPVPVDIRIIAATHRDLENMVASGRFREDLWFRLHVFPIKIPPLRDRKEDIPDLLHYFIKRKAIEKNIPPPPTVLPEAIDRLKSYHWPGNVRELENIVERALIQYQGKGVSGPITFEGLLFPKIKPAAADSVFKDHESSDMDKIIVLQIERILNQALKNIVLPGEERNDPSVSTMKDKPLDVGEKISKHLSRIFGQPPEETVLPQSDHEPQTAPLYNQTPLPFDEAVSLHIQHVLKLTKGKIYGAGGAAELLKMNPSTLRYKMQKLGLIKERTFRSSKSG